MNWECGKETYGWQTLRSNSFKDNKYYLLNKCLGYFYIIQCKKLPELTAKRHPTSLLVMELAKNYDMWKQKTWILFKIRYTWTMDFLSN